MYLCLALFKIKDMLIINGRQRLQSGEPENCIQLKEACGRCLYQGAPQDELSAALSVPSAGPRDVANWCPRVLIWCRKRGADGTGVKPACTAATPGAPARQDRHHCVLSAARWTPAHFRH